MNFKKTRTELIKFSITGILHNIFFYLIFVYLVSLFNYPKLITTLIYPVAVYVSWYFNSRWTFKNKDLNKTKLFKYYFIYIAGYFLTILSLYIQVDILAIAPWIAALVNIFLIAAILFLLQKVWIFKTV